MATAADKGLPLHVCYYVTGHGLGHATRSLLTVEYLLSRGVKVDIISSIDPSFFVSSLSHLITDGLNCQLECFHRCLDSGAIQEHSLKVNALETLQKYLDTVHNKREELLNIEVEFFKSRDIDLIIVDATPLAAKAGKIAGIKVLLLTNFTWDFIYQELLLELRATKKTDESNIVESMIATEMTDEKFEQFNSMINQCTSDYNNADCYAQLPGHPHPNNFNDYKLIETSLIARTFKKSKQDIRNEYELLEEKRILLICFGGHQTEWNLKDEFLPKDWICLVLGARQSDLSKAGRFYAIDFDCYVPDLINASDVVLGKLGYGTLSECIIHKTPLIYIKRSSWPEEKCLQLLLETYTSGLCMPVDDFMTGNWSIYLNKALELNISFEKDSTITRENCPINQIFTEEKLIHLLEIRI